MQSGVAAWISAQAWSTLVAVALALGSGLVNFLQLLFGFGHCVFTGIGDV